jgi:hypothetical protein
MREGIFINRNGASIPRERDSRIKFISTPFSCDLDSCWILGHCRKTAVFAMKLQTIAAISLATIAACLSVRSSAASPKPSSDTSADDNAYPGTSSGKAHAIPFRGVIASFDDKARTFTLVGKESARSLKITDTTVITKGGQPATMKDIVANEEVRGSYYKISDGSLEARTVKLGPLTEAEKAEKEARKEKREAKKASATP